MKVLYGFTAKDIQKYILDGDKLREMVGGSEIINSLCTDLIRDTLQALNVSELKTISEVAGGVRLKMEREDAEKLACIFPLLVEHAAPGIRSVQVIEQVNGSVGNALKRLNERLEATRSALTASLPEIGPLVERNTRTGAPAVCEGPRGEGWHDRRTLLLEKSSGGNTLLRNFAGNGVNPEDWPYDVDHLVTDEHGYLAVVHADGNDLGKLVIGLINMTENEPNVNVEDVLNSFSKAVEDATFRAAQEACKEIILTAETKEVKNKKYYPARPIVLGGDDITVIMRADLALPFTERYLELFEIYTGDKLNSSLKAYKLGDITAGAGIAFVKPAYPFWRAYELAASLANFAKEQSKSDDHRAKEKQAPSSFMFHRVTTSITGDFKEIRDRELTGAGISFCFGPYAVGKYGDRMHSYASLKNLAETIATMPSGPLRRLITTIYSDATRIEPDFNRILEMTNREGKKQGDVFKERLTALTKNATEPLCIESNKTTPLLDALRLIEVGTVKRKREEEVTA